MRNPRNAHKLRTIVNEVQDSPVTYTNAPKISVAFKLLAPTGLGLSRRDSILRTARASTVSGKRSSSFLAEGFTSTT